jgi:hypothetical protein
LILDWHLSLVVEELTDFVCRLQPKGVWLCVSVLQMWVQVVVQKVLKARANAVVV